MPTVTVSVSDDNDEIGVRRNGSSLFGSSTFRVGDQSSSAYDYGGGMRFHPGIPQGYIVSAAKLQVSQGGFSGGIIIPSTIINGELSTNAAQFSTYADFVARDRTSAYVTWTPSSWASDDSFIDSPDLTAVIQELVNQNGWDTDSAVVIFWEDGTPGVYSGAGSLTVNRYHASPSLAPKLVVTFTPPNTAPEITAGPAVAYNGSFTRLGANATPATVTFTATDDEDTGTDDLTWEIRTAASGGGTLVATGSCTSGASKNASVAYNASGISEGSNTLYLRVGDGSLWSDDESFTVLVDATAPTVGTITHSPNPTSDHDYALSFTPSDTYSTDTNELSWQIRTAASGGGTLLDSGTATSGATVNTGTITDSGLAHGTNTRWLSILDGAGNVLDQSFTVTAELLNYFTATMVADASMTAALTSTTAVEATMVADTSVTSALTSTTAVVANMTAEASVEAFLTSTTAVVAEIVAEAFVEAEVTNFVVSGWHRPPLHLEVMVGPHEVEVLSGSNAATAVTGANTIEVEVGSNRLTPEID